MNTVINARDGIYPDHYIEHWGRVYVDQDIRLTNIRFDLFLTAPEYYLERSACMRRRAAASDMLPLLPVQRAVARRIDESQRGGGRVIAMHGNQHVAPVRRRAASKTWKTRSFRQSRASGGAS